MSNKYPTNQELLNKIKNLEDELLIIKKSISEVSLMKKSINETGNSKRYLTLDDILSLEGDAYYDEERWTIFYAPMIEELKKLPNFDSVLEIGPYKAPLIENSDVIDISDFSGNFPFNINNVIIHDCSKIPYPIEDKKYDLVIASQCLEHFGYFGEQVGVFKELARICNKAIVALPYNWFQPLNISHHRIDEKVLDVWQGEFQHTSEVITKSEVNTNRIIIRTYDFSDY